MYFANDVPLYIAGANGPKSAPEESLLNLVSFSY